jgi:hypothetical protein
MITNLEFIVAAAKMLMNDQYPEWLGSTKQIFGDDQVTASKPEPEPKPEPELIVPKSEPKPKSIVFEPKSIVFEPELIATAPEPIVPKPESKPEPIATAPEPEISPQIISSRANKNSEKLELTIKEFDRLMAQKQFIGQARIQWIERYLKKSESKLGIKDYTIGIAYLAAMVEFSDLANKLGMLPSECHQWAEQFANKPALDWELKDWESAVAVLAAMDERPIINKSAEQIALDDENDQLIAITKRDIYDKADVIGWTNPYIDSFIAGNVSNLKSIAEWESAQLKMRAMYDKYCTEQENLPDDELTDEPEDEPTVVIVNKSPVIDWDF